MGVSFVILDEPAEFACPCEGTFDDPPAREENEAAFCFGQFDDFKGDVMALSSLRSPLAGIALIDPGDLDVVAGNGPDFGRVYQLRRDLPRWLKALKFRTPCEAIEELWKSKPDAFIVKPNHHTLGLNT